MATTYLTRTPSSAGSNTVWTVSMWVKRASLASGKLNAAGTSSTYEFLFNGSGGLTLYNGAAEVFTTTRLFRDTSAWYHIVLAYNTTASGTDKCKLYINGTLESSFSTDNRSSAGAMSNINQAVVQYIGKTHAGGFFDGLMSHFNSIDGTQYAASEFGETDSTTGEWKIKTSPSVTYGTNGFFILKDGNSVTDQSGNSNNFTVGGGTLTNTEDCPDNVFCTINPLDNYWQGSTFANGNNTVTTGSNSRTYNTTSFMMATGKFYAECKVISGAAGNQIGVGSNLTASVSASLGTGGEGFVYKENGYYETGGSAVSFGDAYVNGDIIGVALDVTSATPQLYFSKNGVFQGSGNPSAGTGGKSITAVASTTIGAYFFGFCDTATDNTRVHGWNFGNGYFATTAVASAGTNASSNGVFEYDVPANFTALSTKGLNL